MSQGPQPADEESPQRKNLTFVMPFEEDADTPNRLYKLIYWRFKHIIETKINAYTSSDPAVPRNPHPVTRKGKPCQFNVSVVLTRKDAQMTDVMAPIRDSDVAIGFVTRTDVTVVSVTLMYELAVRHLLRSGLVLAIDGDPDKLRPRFMSSLNQIVLTPSWMEDRALLQLSNNFSLKPLGVFDPGRSDEEAHCRLASLSDASDDEVAGALRVAIQSMMDPDNRQRDEIRHLMQDLDPEFMVSTASVFYPAQVIKITWGQRPRDAKGKPHQFTMDDSVDLVVCDWNDKFLEIYNIDPHEAEEAGVLTAEQLQDFQNRYAEPVSYAAYIADQTRLWDLIVLGAQAGVADKPLVFGDDHPNPNFRNRAFLPCCVLKKRMGNPLHEHFLYLLIIFFDVTLSSNLQDNPALIGHATSKAPAANGGPKSGVGAQEK